jgi:hypothetical protein
METMPFFAYPDWWIGLLREMSSEQAAERVLKECGFKYGRDDVRKVAAALTAFHMIRQDRGT